MFRSSFQKGFLTVLYAGGSSPLQIWDRMISNGHVKRVRDEDVKTLVLEMRGTNVATCYIYTPINPKEVLGVRLPFLVMVIKNLKKYFSFEIQILDDRNMRRRFRVSNYQTTTKVRPFGTTMPIGLNPGWNQIQFNLADFTKRAYGSSYVETQRIQIHANCRIRRIYFCDKLYPEKDLPNEYKLFYPCIEDKKKKQEVVKDVRTEVPPPSEAGDEVEPEQMEQQEAEEPVEETPQPIEAEELITPQEEDAMEEPAVVLSGTGEAVEDIEQASDAEQRDTETGQTEGGDAEQADAEPLEEAAEEAEEPTPAAAATSAPVNAADQS